MPEISSSNAATADASPKGSFARLLAALLAKGKRLVTRQQLPRVARQACQTYLDSDDIALQRKCQQVLRARLQLNPHQLQRFLNTAVGQSLLAWIRHFFHWTPQQNPEETLTELLVQMATDPEGLSLLTAARYCPGVLAVDPDHLLLSLKRMEWLVKTTRTVTETVAQLAAAESELSAQALEALPDLRQPGPWSIEETVITLPGRIPLHPWEGAPRSLEVTCYRPSPWPPHPKPLIVQSHGLASAPQELQRYAQHLASYGFCVMVPRHAGSDVEQMRRLLAGDAHEVFHLSDFISRPADISYLLDELSRPAMTAWSEHLDLENVGIIGHSFGAYTALALAGATIQFEGLEDICGLPNQEPNPSLLLQCQALTLPRQVYQLRDRRVQAVIAIDAVGSEIFGRTGLAQIQVPVMLMAGSHDVTAPLVLEQLRIFRRLTATQPYFVLMRGKAHLRDLRRFIQSIELDCQASTTAPTMPPTTETALTLVENSIKALSLAFLGTHLQPELGYSAYLNAGYGQYFSQPPHDCWLISDRSKAALEATLQKLDENYLSELMT